MVVTNEFPVLILVYLVISVAAMLITKYVLKENGQPTIVVGIGAFIVSRSVIERLGEKLITNRIYDFFILISILLLIIVALTPIIKCLLKRSWRTTIIVAAGTFIMSTLVVETLGAALTENRIHDFFIPISVFLAIFVIAMLVTYLVKKNWETAITIAIFVFVISEAFWRIFMLLVI